ncbi:unnamed protein product [Symbiodinium sp. CCMP2592]|nr:unnamed protein product [Symbiodinium sp. CCMP2592]
MVTGTWPCTTTEVACITKVGIPVRFDPSTRHAFWWRTAYPTWEESTFQIFRRFVRPDSIVLDVGGWIGSTSIWLAALAQKVLVLEPSDAAFEELVQNVAQNADRIDTGLANLVRALMEVTSDWRNRFTEGKYMALMRFSILRTIRETHTLSPGDRAEALSQMTPQDVLAYLISTEDWFLATVILLKDRKANSTDGDLPGNPALPSTIEKSDQNSKIGEDEQEILDGATTLFSYYYNSEEANIANMIDGETSLTAAIDNKENRELLVFCFGVSFTYFKRDRPTVLDDVGFLRTVVEGKRGYKVTMRSLTSNHLPALVQAMEGEGASESEM